MLRDSSVAMYTRSAFARCAGGPARARGSACAGDPACVKACKDQSGNPQGPCLMTNKLGFGVNLAFRDVTPDQAGKDLLDLTFYPSVDGKRPTPAKTKKTRR